MTRQEVADRVLAKIRGARTVLQACDAFGGVEVSVSSRAGGSTIENVMTFDRRPAKPALVWFCLYPSLHRTAPMEHLTFLVAWALGTLEARAMAGGQVSAATSEHVAALVLAELPTLEHPTADEADRWRGLVRGALEMERETRAERRAGPCSTLPLP